MSVDRSDIRDVFIWDSKDKDDEDGVPLGGLALSNGVTIKDFRQMINILIVVEETGFTIKDEHGAPLPEDNHALRPGNYYISGKFAVSKELVYHRAASITTGPRVQEFRKAVRARDGGCVVSKIQNRGALSERWLGFEAAHIWPLAYEAQWRENNCSRWITIDPPQGGKINSVQNGLLLQSNLHVLWDNYCLSINPDRPVDQLLRWHFRQAVLTNMRGAGEPAFESDFPPHSDMMGEILAGPKAAERMEFELFDRLAHQREI